MIFFSIIIPTLNEENFLPKLLTDLKNQKEKNFEVIVVDARSEDKTQEKANEFRSQFPLKFYSVNRRHLSYQRNFGAKKASGSFLVFLDADIRIKAVFLKKLHAEIKKNRSLAYVPSNYPQEGTSSIKFFYKLSNFIVGASQSSSTPFPTAGAMIFHRDFFHFLGGYQELKAQEKKIFYPEDHEILLRMRRCRVRARFLNDIKIGSSLRRINKEGPFNTFKLYIISSVAMTFKGKMEKQLIYEMGGHLYRDFTTETKK